ncbi:MAG: PIN domain-containing protein [Eggerthellaceae bacterium]|nr:PIN domain-containing protein [Eggerthellaceae bacterium]
MKLLLDTNILIDLIACREPFAADARKICAASFFKDVQAWVTAQSYADAFYVLSKGSSEAIAKRLLLKSLTFFLPCSTFASDLKPALESDWPDVEDYLIAHASKHVNADVMITRDADMMQRCPIQAMTAHQFLEMLEEEQGLVYEDVPF